MRKLFTALAAAMVSVSAFAQINFDLRTNPEPGNVSELSTIELISGNMRYNYVEITSQDDVKILKDGQEFCGVTAKNNATTATLTLQTPATTEGTYTLVLPEGSWARGNTANEAYEDGAETQFTYTIGGQGGDVTTELVSVDPAPNTQVTAPFSQITLTSKDSELTWVAALSASEVGVYQGDTQVSGVRASQTADGKLNVTFRNPITTDGMYTVKIPAGALVVTNESEWPEKEIPAMELVYMVAGGDQKIDPVIVANPASGTLTEPLSTVTLTSGVADYALDIISADDIKVLKDGEDFCGVTVRNNVVTLKETVTESAQYTLFIPAGAWEIGNYSDEENPKIVAGVDQSFVYDVEIGGPKYNVEMLFSRLTPNGDDEENPGIDLNGTYDGVLTQFYINVDGEYYPVEGATVNIYNKRAGFNQEAKVTANKPTQNSWSKKWQTRVFFDLEEGITTDGTYTITIPRGIIGDAAYVEDHNTGVANKAYTWTVLCVNGLPEPEPTVKYDLGIKSSKPAEGMVDMSNFTWEVTTFTVDADYNLAPNSTKEATLVSETAGYNRSGKITLSSQTDYVRTFKFMNGSEPSTNGTYVITIPEATFGDAEWQEDPTCGHTNPEIKIYVLVNGASGAINTAYDVEVASVTPANAASVSVAENPVEISFTAAGEYSFYPQMKINVACEGAEYNGTATIASATVADGVTTFTTTLAQPITVNGDYTLTFPEGLFGDADYIANWTTGHASKAFTSTFTVTGGADQPEPMKFDLNPEITPASEANLNLNEKVVITFVFPEGTKPTNDSPRASMKCPEANYFDTALFIKGDVDGTYLLKYGTAPKRAGVYTIEIAENTFFNETLNSANPKINLAFNIGLDSIESIFDEAEIEGGVYNLNGVYVGENLKDLPAGIYLMKGRKVIVKK